MKPGAIQELGEGCSVRACAFNSDGVDRAMGLHPLQKIIVSTMVGPELAGADKFPGRGYHCCMMNMFVGVHSTNDSRCCVCHN